TASGSAHAHPHFGVAVEHAERAGLDRHGHVHEGGSHVHRQISGCGEDCAGEYVDLEQLGGQLELVAAGGAVGQVGDDAATQAAVELAFGMANDEVGRQVPVQRSLGPAV